MRKELLTTSYPLTLMLQNFIIHNCRTLFGLYYENSSVKFVRRQSNEIVYELVKAATLSISFQILITIPDCIEYILSNEML